MKILLVSLGAAALLGAAWAQPLPMSSPRKAPPRGWDVREWQNGEAPVRLIPANEGFCTLLSVAGNFEGYGEWAGLWVGKDNFWYLGGRSMQPGLSAQCLVIPFAAITGSVPVPPAERKPDADREPETIWTERGTGAWRDLRLVSPTEGGVEPPKGEEQAGVNGRMFPRGQFLWAHAPSRLVYTFEEPVTQFRAMAALRDGGSMGNVTFQVETEGGVVFQSMVLAHRSTTSQTFTIDFPPTRRLVLSALPNGPNYEDWAVWVCPQVR